MVSMDLQVELIFYYLGYGNNDEVIKEFYLLLVDIIGKNICLGILLSDLYKKLVIYLVKGVYVFFDVCFSGGYKSVVLLLVQKGVCVVLKVGLL